MEFEAETWGFCSPHEYYKTPKFQLQTPSLSAPTGNQFFRDVGQKKITNCFILSTIKEKYCYFLTKMFQQFS